MSLLLSRKTFCGPTAIDNLAVELAQHSNGLNNTAAASAASTEPPNQPGVRISQPLPPPQTASCPGNGQSGPSATSTSSSDTSTPQASSSGQANAPAKKQSSVASEETRARPAASSVAPKQREPTGKSDDPLQLARGAVEFKEVLRKVRRTRFCLPLQHLEPLLVFLCVPFCLLGVDIPGRSLQFCRRHTWCAPFIGQPTHFHSFLLNVLA